MMDEIGQHHTDCHESERDGAAAIGPHASRIQGQVMSLFSKYGPMTDEELLERYVATYGHIYKNSLEPRRYELVRAGALCKSAIRRQGKSGVRRIVWAPLAERALTT